jgi:hypothetical protein
MVVVLLLPVALVVLVALVAALVVGRSTLHITTAGVEVRNYPQAPKMFALAEVRGFEATPRAGNFSSLRPATAALVLTDGSRVPVRKISAPDAGYGIDALNRRIDTLRSAG